MALTKTRFALATECAYKDRPGDYIDTSRDNAYLTALAEAGFQVGELARRLYEGGELIEGNSMDERVARMAERLKQDEVTLYEAAIPSGDLLIVVDVLRKQGKRSSCWKSRRSPMTRRRTAISATVAR